MCLATCTALREGCPSRTDNNNNKKAKCRIKFTVQFHFHEERKYMDNIGYLKQLRPNREVVGKKKAFNFFFKHIFINLYGNYF